MDTRKFKIMPAACVEFLSDGAGLWPGNGTCCLQVFVLASAPSVQVWLIPKSRHLPGVPVISL